MTTSLARIAALVLLAAACAPGAAPTARPAADAHVVLVVMDGLRPDAIAASGAPNLKRLVAAAAASLEARAVEIPETLPGFVTMASGVPPSRHGVTWNDDRGIALTVPTIYSRLGEAARPSALYYGKSKLLVLAPPSSGAVTHGPARHDRDWELGDGERLARAFAAEFARRPPAFALVHLREPDYVGHDAGWMSSAYLEAVRKDDAALGVVLDAIAASPAAARTTLLLTADHGGEGDHHRRKGTDLTWTIPWLCHRPGLRAQTLPGTPTLLDIAPTVLALLGLPALPEMQGRVVKECLPSR